MPEDITSLLREKDEIRFKRINVNATGTYTDEPPTKEAKGKTWFFTRYENGEVILDYDGAALLNDEERKLRQAWEAEERKKQQATITGSKKGPLGKQGPMNKARPFRK